MDLIYDYRKDSLQMVSEPLSRKNSLKRFRGRNQQVRGLNGLLPSSVLTSIPMSNRNCQSKVFAEFLNSSEDIPIESSQGSDVENIEAKELALLLKLM